jgi:hypothetical protein
MHVLNYLLVHAEKDSLTTTCHFPKVFQIRLHTVGKFNTQFIRVSDPS